jgi:hypothetical protein
MLLEFPIHGYTHQHRPSNASHFREHFFSFNILKSSKEIIFKCVLVKGDIDNSGFPPHEPIISKPIECMEAFFIFSM